MATACAEWRKYWPLVLAASAGNSLTVMHVYSMGPFIQPLQDAFDWTRAKISIGLTITSLLGSMFGIGVGVALDYLGPRRIGLIGIPAVAFCFSMLGTANGSLLNWVLLWAMLAFGYSLVKPTVWTSAVASRFDKSRGLAISLTITGSGFAAIILPLATTLAIEYHGWRLAYLLIGGLWGMAVLPFALFFFRGAQDGDRKIARGSQTTGGAVLDGLEVRECLRTPAFYKISIAGMLYCFVVLAMIVHFVEILGDYGVARRTAASIAGIIGIGSIVGRLFTGYLLDRMNPNLVSAIAFAAPIIGLSLLLFGSGFAAYASAAGAIGWSLGAELDVVLYLATRHFGLKRFGTMFALVMVMLAMGTAIGPMAAGLIYDKFGSYHFFLLFSFPVLGLAALMIGSLGRFPRFRTPAT